jgi:hypothetical protein
MQHKNEPIMIAHHGRFCRHLVGVAAIDIYNISKRNV